MSDALREAAQQALEALESLQGGCTDSDDGTVEAITVWCPEIIDALKAALAEPVQEPEARQTMTPKELAASLKRGEKWTLAEPVIESVSKAQA